MPDGSYSSIIGKAIGGVPQNFVMASGSHLMLKVTVFNNDGHPTPLTNVDAAVWRLTRDNRSAPLLTKTIGQGVTIITDQAAAGQVNCGRLNVLISASESADLVGEYLHECSVSVGSTWTGRIFHGRAWVDPSLPIAEPAP